MSPALAITSNRRAARGSAPAPHQRHVVLYNARRRTRRGRIEDQAEGIEGGDQLTVALGISGSRLEHVRGQGLHRAPYPGGGGLVAPAAGHSDTPGQSGYRVHRRPGRLQRSLHETRLRRVTGYGSLAPGVEDTPEAAERADRVAQLRDEG